MIIDGIIHFEKTFSDKISYNLSLFADRLNTNQVGVNWIVYNKQRIGLDQIGSIDHRTATRGPAQKILFAVIKLQQKIFLRTISDKIEKRYPGGIIPFAKKRVQKAVT